MFFHPKRQVDFPSGTLYKRIPAFGGNNLVEKNKINSQLTGMWSDKGVEP